jgi:hypothetical protein
MSLETALAENTAILKELVELNRSIVDNQTRLLAGQEAALAKITAPKATTATKDAPAQTDRAAERAAKAATQKANAPSHITPEKLLELAQAYLSDKSKDEKKAINADQIKPMLEHFGSPKLAGPESTLNGDERDQAAFYIKRWASGGKVDFNAEYDFAGDPMQGTLPDEGEEEDALA